MYERYVPDPPPLDDERAKRIIYEGTRPPGMEGLAGVLLDGCPDVLPWRLDLYNHSPTGFEWGYVGSGPSQLALAILAHATGDDAYAVAKHTEFTTQIVSAWGRNWFKASGEFVLTWVRANPISKEDRFNHLPQSVRSEIMDRSVVEDFPSECCQADQTYESQDDEGRRRSFAVCNGCGSKAEF